MATANKYATDEERRAAIAAKMRANWRKPHLRAAWVKSLRAVGERKARQDGLSGEMLAQVLREYTERDPTNQRDWRYTVEQLGRRYLISAPYVAHLACKHGLKRRKRMKKLGPAKVRAILKMRHEDGLQIVDIARALGVSKTAISYRLKTASADCCVPSPAVDAERIAA